MFPQKQILRQGFKCRKLIWKVKGDTGSGVGEADRGMAANGDTLSRPVTTVELNSMGKLLDMIQNTHFRTVPRRGSWLRAAQFWPAT